MDALPWETGELTTYEHRIAERSDSSLSRFPDLIRMVFESYILFFSLVFAAQRLAAHQNIRR